MKSTSIKRGRPSKYTVLAVNLLEKAGFNTDTRSKNRIEKISNFLKNNYRNSSRIFVTSNYSDAENAKKSQLVGYSNAPSKLHHSSRCWVVLK